MTQRITYMGKTVWPRVRKTGQFTFKSRWQRFTAAVVYYTKLVGVGALTVAILLGVYAVGFSQRELVATNSVAEAAIAIDTSPEKIEQAKMNLVATLESCEGAGHTWEEGFILMDTNNKLSYGPLQFQKATVIHYFEALYGKKITGLEAVNAALDKDTAEKLAHDIIFTTKAGVENDWYNCSNKHHLQLKVDLIKELEQ